MVPADVRETELFGQGMAGKDKDNQGFKPSSSMARTLLLPKRGGEPPDLGGSQ
jgi:hypothetical protein